MVKETGVDLPCALSLAPTCAVAMNGLYPRGWVSLIFVRDLWLWVEEGVIISICSLSCNHVKLFCLSHTKMSWDHFASSFVQKTTIQGCGPRVPVGLRQE